MILNLEEKLRLLDKYIKREEDELTLSKSSACYHAIVRHMILLEEIKKDLKQRGK